MQVQLAPAHALGRFGQPPDGAREALGEPQRQPHGGGDQQQGEAQIDQRKFQQHSAAIAFQLLIFADGFAGVVQQAEQAAIDVAGDIQEAVGQRRQRHQRAEFILRPILDQDRAIAAGGVQLRRIGALVPEIIGPLATGMDGAGAVDNIGLAQAPLGARLLVGQDQAQVAIVDQRIGRGRLTQHHGDGGRVLGQVDAVFFLIGDGGGLGIAHHLAHAVGKPALQPDIDHDARE